MSVEPLQRFVFEERGDRCRPLDPRRARHGRRPLSWGSEGEVMAPPPAGLLPLLEDLFPASPLPPAGRPRRRSQHLEDIRRHGAAQVLPGLLSRRVPQLHVRTEVLHQQPQYVAVAVDGGDMERRVAAR